LLTCEQYVLEACSFCLQSELALRFSKTKQHLFASMKVTFFIDWFVHEAFFGCTVDRMLENVPGRQSETFGKNLHGSVQKVFPVQSTLSGSFSKEKFPIDDVQQVACS
jgi:hypothetical protein